MANYTPQTSVPLTSKWHHWPTYIYDQNYGYGMNYYQPMIDYIDKKTYATNDRRIEIPELPWNNGRIFWEDKPIRLYSRNELMKLSIDAEHQARDHLLQFKVDMSRK